VQLTDKEIELIAEKVMQKLEWYHMITEIAQAILQQMGEEDKERLRKLTTAQGKDEPAPSVECPEEE
jgi:hypothetical protein